MHKLKVKVHLPESTDEAVTPDVLDVTVKWWRFRISVGLYGPKPDGPQQLTEGFFLYMLRPATFE